MAVETKSGIVTITEEAREQVVKVLEAQDNPDLFLRIYVQGGHGGIAYGMAIDSRFQEGDSDYDVDGLRVVIDRISFPYVDGATVAYDSEGGKAGFRITNPKAEELLASMGSCSSGSCSSGACGSGGCGSGGCC